MHYTTPPLLLCRLLSEQELMVRGVELCLLLLPHIGPLVLLTAGMDIRAVSPRASLCLSHLLFLYRAHAPPCYDRYVLESLLSQGRKGKPSPAAERKVYGLSTPRLDHR